MIVRSAIAHHASRAIALCFSDERSPNLDKGIFTELQNIEYFQQVKLSFGSIQWPHEQDFSPDTFYLTGQLEETTVEPISPSPALG